MALRVLARSEVILRLRIPAFTARLISLRERPNSHRPMQSVYVSRFCLFVGTWFLFLPGPVLSATSRARHAAPFHRIAALRADGVQVGCIHTLHLLTAMWKAPAVSSYVHPLVGSLV